MGTYTQPDIDIDLHPLISVYYFTCLGSNIPNNATTPKDVVKCIVKAWSSFGHLEKLVFRHHSLRSDTTHYAQTPRLGYTRQWSSTPFPMSKKLESYT